MTELPWFERMRLGFQKTSDRLGDNLTGLINRSSLDERTLDDIEEALIASDLGPATAAKIRARLASDGHDITPVRRSALVQGRRHL